MTVEKLNPPNKLKTPAITTGSEINSEDLSSDFLQCNLCGPNAWKGPKCADCECYRKEHYAEGIGAKAADFFVVAESPYLSGPSGDIDNHTTWKYDVEKVVKDALSRYKTEHPHTMNLHGRFTSSVRCSIDKPKKKMRECCYPLFRDELLQCARREDIPLMVLALGPSVVQSFGVKVGKYASVQGKFLEAKIGGRRAIIFPTLSKRALLVKSGYFEIFRRHVEIFMDAVYGLQHGVPVQTETPLAELIKNYVFPKKLDDVRKLVETIVEYAQEGKNPDNHVIAIDTETNTLYPHREKLKILSLVVSWGPGLAASIPIEHPDTPWTLEEIHPYITQLLQCPKPKGFHNAKFDLKVLRRKGWEVRRFAWDTMLGEHLISEDKRGYYSLKALTKLMLPRYSGYEDQLQSILEKLETKDALKDELKGMAKKLAQDEGFMNIPLKELNEYGAVDADVTRQLITIQRARIEEENRTLNKRRAKLGRSKYFQKAAQPGNSSQDPLKDIMFDRSVPASRALAAMELYGMAVDQEYIEELVVDMDQSIIMSKMKLFEMIPSKLFEDEFNPNSTAHLRKVLFGTGFYHPESGDIISYNHLDEEELSRTPTGQISTDAKFLRSLVTQHDCPFAKELLKFRGVSKARNTFVENIRALSREDGKMHTSFHISGTATGRLSSSDENMQNIPKRIGSHNIKKIFIPTDPENQLIINADAKAAEVRIYAAYSRDPNLIQALNDGMDPHSFFSSMVYKPESVLQGVRSADKKKVLETIGIDDAHAWDYNDFQNREQIEKDDPWYGKQLGKLRKNVKRVVFGILYGASKNKISVIVGIPHDQAQAIIDVLFRMFPTIPKYIQLTKDQVHNLGIVETFIGRRRRFDLDGMTRYLIAKAERQAVNFKIQSTSSDIVLGVLCEVDHPIRELGGRLLITVHDSIVFELPKKYIAQMPDFFEEYGVRRVAKQYPWLPVPFKWDVEVGPSYGELQSVENYLSENPVVEFNQEDYDIMEEEIRKDFTNLR